MDRKNAGELQQHMLGTYHALRVTLTVIGVALPILIVGVGWIQQGRIWIEPSISQYYYVSGRFPFFTTRDFFVGLLLAISVCLYAYKGFSTRESVALNVAGIFAFFVAVLPTSADDQDRGLRSVLHGIAAVLFFLSIAYVILRRSRDTLRLLPQTKQEKYARLYFFTSLAMIMSPAIAVILSFALDPRSSKWIFFVEALSVWSFAAYWWIKTREMGETDAERRALNAKLERKLVSHARPISAGSTHVSALDRLVQRVMVPNDAQVERIVPAGNESVELEAPATKPAAP
jgi:hypothetical protein